MQSTQDQILEVAEDIVRSRGYNGFSYADIASEIGVTKASLHHYFPSKADLGLALIDNFSSKVTEAISEVMQTHSSAVARLQAYAGLYEMALEENKMCLCGMLAVEHETLTAKMQEGINAFFAEHETWIEQVLIEGRDSGELAFDGDALDHARLILSNCQGTLMVAKSQHSIPNMRATVAKLIDIYRAK